MKEYKTNPVRELARSYHWQVKYKHSKELGIKLFANDIDLTPIQLQFLQYLEMYASLYEDSANNEDYINFTDKKGDDKSVIGNEVLEDSYLYWRRNCKYKKEKQDKYDRPKQLIVGGLAIPSKCSIRDE